MKNHGQPAELSGEETARADALYAKYGAASPDLGEAVPVDPMVTTSLRIPAHTHKAIRAAARRAGVRPAVLIRQWIDAGLAGDQEAVPVAELEAVIARHRAS